MAQIGKIAAGPTDGGAKFDVAVGAEDGDEGGQGPDEQGEAHLLMENLGKFGGKLSKKLKNFGKNLAKNLRKSGRNWPRS